VRSPLLFVEETRRDVIVASNWKRQSRGGRCRLVESHTPPMPKDEASTVPKKAGVESTISAHRVGRLPRFWSSQRKSSSWSWTAGVRRRRSAGWGLAEWTMTDWSWENRPRPPGMARVMLRSSPTSCCHFLREVRVCRRGSASRSSPSRSRRCGGSSIVR
jgi:hypothetical protein